MPEHARTLRPGYLASLVQAQFQPETPPGIQPDRHLRVPVDDIAEAHRGAVLPAETHVRKLVEYLKHWPADAPLLIHCFAGISRSTAAALIVLALHVDEHDAAQQLRAAAPHAHPNRRIIALADQILGRDGRLIAAREAMGPGAMVSEGPLVTLPIDELRVVR